MSFAIIDGTGKGTEAAVTNSNRLSVLSHSISAQMHQTLSEKLAFQAHSGELTLTNAGRHGILALRNDSQDKTYVITYIRCGINSAEVLEATAEVKLKGTWVDGTPSNGIYNMNTSSLNTPDATLHTGNSLSNASVIDMYYYKGPNEVSWTKEGSIAINAGGIISIDLVTQSPNVKAYGRISFIALNDSDLLDYR